MLKKYIAIFFLLFCSSVYSFEDLGKKYQVSFGDPNAEIKITEYFSFSCPHCTSLFKKDFPSIQSDFLDTKKASWVFHPVPMDLLTVQAMVCLEQLSNEEKKVFLEAILSEGDGVDPNTVVILMKKAMEYLGKVPPKIDHMQFLEGTDAFQNSFLFITQEDIVQAVPCVRFNGELFRRDFPTKEFIKRKIG